MEKLIVDSKLRAQLSNVNESLEVCDETGRTLGHFLPPAMYEDLFYSALAAGTPFTKEELKRRDAEKGKGRPLAEIWKSLGRT